MASARCRRLLVHATRHSVIKVPPFPSLCAVNDPLAAPDAIICITLTNQPHIASLVVESITGMPAPSFSVVTKCWPR